MRIKAIVEIKLNMDGSWELISLDAPPESAPETENTTVREHFKNLRRIKDERTNAKGNTSPKHCSVCGKVHHNLLTHEEHKHG